MCAPGQGIIAAGLVIVVAIIVESPERGTAFAVLWGAWLIAYELARGRSSRGL